MKLSYFVLFFASIAYAQEGSQPTPYLVVQVPAGQQVNASLQTQKPDAETQFILNHAAGVAHGFAHILSDPNNPQNVGSNLLTMAGHVLDIFFTVARRYISENPTIDQVEQWLVSLSDEERLQLHNEIIHKLEKKLNINAG